MSDEIVKDEVVKTEVENHELSWNDVRNSKAGQELFGEINKLKESLAAREQADAEKAQQEALKRGEHESVIEQLRAEKTALAESIAATQRENDLRFALLEAGVTDKLTLAGAIALYDGKVDAAEYAASVASSQAESRQSQKLPPAGGVKPATTGQLAGAQLKQQLNDPKTASQASKLLTAYVAEHGSMPPGFD